MIRGPQITAARTLLGWSIRDLARRTGLDIADLQELESGAKVPNRRRKRTSVHIHSLAASDFRRFQPAPPGGTGFFIGDQNGGSGWEIPRPDGTIDKYYIDLPPDIGQVDIYLSKAPAQHAHVPAAELVRMYLDRLEQLVAEAKQRFGA